MVDTASCEECAKLKKSMDYDYWAWRGYRPTHNGYRPKSRWRRGDAETVTDLERQFHKAAATYRLHIATHEGQSTNPADVTRYLEILMREGRLKP
jgi:hypothetical protein